MNPMPSRRPHTKTRLGCRQCKARKVRCDEVGPVCKACTRRGEQCSLDPTNTERLPTPTSTSLSSANTDLSPAACLDLRLMHHFTHTVALTLTASRPAQITWQVTVPQRAETQPILMHALLALSGLHLSQHSESKVYSQRALCHRQAALFLFRKDLASLEAKGSTPHVDTLTLVSTIIAMLSFAEWNVDERSPSLDDIVDIFALARGSNTLWRTGYHVGLDSSIAAIYHHTSDRDAERSLSPWTADDEELRRRLQVEQANVTDPTHSDALEVLQNVIHREAEGTTEIQQVGHWPACISSEFLSSLQARDAVSVSILEIWGLFIRRCEHLWWIGDWYRKVQRAAKESQAPHPSSELAGAIWTETV